MELACSVGVEGSQVEVGEEGDMLAAGEEESRREKKGLLVVGLEEERDPLNVCVGGELLAVCEGPYFSECGKGSGAYLQYVRKGPTCSRRGKGKGLTCCILQGYRLTFFRQEQTGPLKQNN